MLGDALEGGAMAHVFRARDTGLGRDIVIKVLAPDLAADVSAERFRREIATAARLQHPQIVPVLDAGEIDGLPWYTMPFVTGESLQRLIEGGRLPARAAALDVLRDVARALAAAHEQGIVHRDIKPGNVLLSGGSAVVTDFGIARAIASARQGHAHATGMLTGVGMSIGTPAYMAPEQAAADVVDARADVYAWGIMAYQLLAGVHPFAHRTDARQLLAAQLTEMPAPLLARAAGLDPRVASLVMRCIAKEPESRPADGSVLLKALDAAVIGDAIGSASLRADGVRRWVAPVVLCAVVVAGLVVLRRAAAPRVVAPADNAGAAALPVLAVLPFESVGPGSDSLFADGLSEAITGKLARLSGLRVIDRASVLSMVRDARGDARAVGRELGAQYLLRATVRWARAGESSRIQIVPTVVRVADGTTLWAGEPLSTAVGDPFAVQAALATQVADALDVAIVAVEREQLRRIPTADAAAFAAYERGHRYETRFRIGADAAIGRSALAAFDDALGADPLYADALGAKARLIRDMVRRRQLPATWSDSTLALARRALAVDSTQWIAAELLAQDAVARGAPGDAFAIVERAVAARPSSGALQLVRAEIAVSAGDTALARDAVQKAIVLAPRDADVLERAAFQAFMSLRDPRLADSLARRAVTRDSSVLPAWRMLVEVAVATGDSLRATDAWRGYLLHGGPVTWQLFSVLRRGPRELRDTFDSLSLGSLAASTPIDSLAFFTEHYRDAALRGRTADERAWMEKATTVMTRLSTRVPSAPPGPAGSAARVALQRAWWAAVRGASEEARALLSDATRLVGSSTVPSAGPWPAEWACRRAEVQAMLRDVEAMLDPLRACLSAPGGYWPPQLSQEPMFAPLLADARVKGLLSAAVPVLASPR
jgi:eukaryotic-like serine/threonine-protein kinase